MGNKQKHWTDLRDNSISARFNQSHLKPITHNQKKYFDAVESSVITFCTGPAGAGKTFVACGLAAKALKDGKVHKIIITRPLVTCGTGMGFLPGDVNEKITPYMMPLLDAFEEFFDSVELQSHIRNKTIELIPLELMRGKSIKGAFIICDEAQNIEYNQLHMFLTRFGVGSKVVITGDATQSDLTGGRENPLKLVINKCKVNCHKDISIVKLYREDIVRHPLIRWIDERLGPPTESEFGFANCPECQTKVFYRTEVEEDNELVSCFYCKAKIELFDEEGNKRPASVESEEFASETFVQAG